MIKMNIPQGLYVQNNFITPEDSLSLLQEIDRGEWRPDLGRRTQHYGFRYDYARKKVVSDAPPIAGSVVERCVKLLSPNFELLSGGLKIENVIVNEYVAKQKISKHIDSTQFGPVVMTLTLGDTAEMVMEHNGVTCIVPVGDRTVIALTKDARYVWTHEIKPNNRSTFRRVSVTVRSIAV